MQEFDYLIVGAGAAGSVIASRLSEAPGTKVLLVEAGKDLTPGREPADIRSIFPLAAFNERYMWPNTPVHWRGAMDSPRTPLPQGRIVGGSSNIMGMWALRGMPGDYEEWARIGATGWAWNDVLPFFRQLESDQDFGGPMHGSNGPVPIRRERRDSWSPLAMSVSDEMRRRGWVHVEDLNADFRDGHCTMANSRYEHSRASAGICYLTAEVRRRPNLCVVTERTIERLIADKHRVIGATARRPDGSEETFLAHETIMAAGALRTPTLMMRSGIGPANQLRNFGITIVADRPGVGENLQNHAVIYVCALLNGLGQEKRGSRPAASTYLRWSSKLPGCGAGDSALYVRSYLSWHALGRRMASLAATLQSPASRGCVRLDGCDPDTEPRIEFKLLSDERDLVRVVSATRLAIDLFATAGVRKICGDPLVLTNASGLMRFNRISWVNAFRAQLAATCIDVSPRFGSAILCRMAGMRSAAPLAADEQELREFVKEFVTGTGHVCGTCRMGTANDPLATCDAAGRVYGMGGLRIADASVMPTVPSGNTHIPAIMVAEKIAAAVTSHPTT